MIAKALQSLPQKQLDAVFEAVSNAPAGAPRIYNWICDATAAEIWRRRGKRAKIPPLPVVDREWNAVAVRCFAQTFRNEPQYRPLMDFLNAIVVQLSGFH